MDQVIGYLKVITNELSKTNLYWIAGQSLDHTFSLLFSSMIIFIWKTTKYEQVFPEYTIALNNKDWDN